MNITLIDYFGLAIFLFLFTAQLFLRSRVHRLTDYATLIGTAGVFLILLSFSVGQYYLWQQEPASRGLLPPYNPNGYSFAINYIFFRFWAQYLLSFAIALLFGFLSNLFNKRLGGKFLEKEESHFIFLAIFFIGHPFWILYFLAVLIGAVLYTLAVRLFRYAERVPFYYLWLSVAIGVICLKQPLLHFEFIRQQFDLLKF